MINTMKGSPMKSTHSLGYATLKTTISNKNFTKIAKNEKLTKIINSAIFIHYRECLKMVIVRKNLRMVSDKKDHSKLQKKH